MRRFQVVHAAVTAILLLGWIATGTLVATGNLKLHWVQHSPGENSADSASRPVERAAPPDNPDGKAPFYHERNARPQANSSYPEWFRGTTPGGWADTRSRYRYTQLVGPKNAGLHANSLLMGTLHLKPKTTYPAHSHPAAEIYYILEGEADWWVDGVMRKVTPGTVILHKPNAVHGWRTTSATELKVIWIWWAENRETPGVLDERALLTDRELAEREETALPFSKRLPLDTDR